MGTLCLDMNEGCAGYINGLYGAYLLVSSGQCRKVLLQVVDTVNKLTNQRTFPREVSFVIEPARR